NHSFSLRRYYANMLAGGSAVILNGVLNIKKYYEAMDKYGVTALALVPAVITVLMKLSKGKLNEYASVIRYAQVGSAPMTDGQKDFLRTMLPGVPLYNIFGSTEAGCSSCFDFSSDKDYAGCIGRANVNARIFFVDENRNPIEATKEVPGLMVTAGSHIMNGYYNDPEETALALIDGAIYSKDLGYTDEEGFICIIGRKGDVINVHGHKVAPEEVEGLALKIEGIADCICAGISDGQGSQVVKLYYVPEGEGADPVAIRDFLAERLESYKVPREIETIPKVPRTFNGKIDRKVFKDR
ncbi:MAG: long-chain fatty acid--CoA ligase, partial [Parasporobacterium sp.]|nr:long-chain fatty acid--CoA ligase [Parasporobacterium sp.]